MGETAGRAGLRSTDPRTIGVYRVLGRLGSGNQGVVYLAEAPSGARVAIKQLLSEGEDEQDRQQLTKEVAAARLVAPFCTAQLLDVRLEGPSPYVVSEYISGPTLSQKVRDEGPMTGTALQRLAIGTVTALAAIHQAGVVHRDFKPANVMLSPDGPRVIDFGIARDLATDMTETSRVIGTPVYMSPEQLRNEPVEPASDMFAWASVIAYAATELPPFDGDHMMAVAYRILSGEPTLTGVPDVLLPVLERCLVKDPALRPTAEQVLAMLLGRTEPKADANLLVRGSRIAEAVTPVPLPAPLPGPLPSPAAASVVGSARRRMTRGRWTAVAGVLLIFLALGGWAVDRSIRSDRSTGSVVVAVASEFPSVTAAPTDLPTRSTSQVVSPTAAVSATHRAVKKKQVKPEAVTKTAAKQEKKPSPSPARVVSATGTGPIVGIAGKCLDIANAQSENGTLVQIVACNQTKAQIWSAEDDGTIQALGKCLNVVTGTVEINECDGTDDQTWRIASGVIVNTGSGRCLATLGGDTTERTPVVVSSCSGSDAQAWALQA